jgi:TRAP-type C4-dicarboxylate transport system permease small subunit
MKYTPIIAATVLAACCPAMVVAEGEVNVDYLKGYKESFFALVNETLIPLLLAIAFIVFLYGVFKYFILGGADEKSHEEGRQFVLWGVIAFVVITSVWGLVRVVINTVNLGDNSQGPPPPQL